MSQHNVQGATTKPTNASDFYTSLQTYSATYSPDDNKLRLYASHRLDEETYQRVKQAGFKYAPKQQLFVAPMWTPGRVDLLIELAGQIDDEDQSLVERQEERAERFEGYSEKRATESEQQLNAVDALTSAIPLGQPILVGHHSERRARKHAQRIENGMRRAVDLFETSEYWQQRAAGSLRLAKYKELPAVRYRRIKRIEADLRKAQRAIDNAEKFTKLWSLQTLDRVLALKIADRESISACFTLEKYPRPADKSQYEGAMSIWSALTDEIITTEQARDICLRCHQRTIARCGRWVDHYNNRLTYERAMLDESGGVLASGTEMEPGGKVLSRGEWLTIVRVNRSGGKISSVVTTQYSFMGGKGHISLTLDRISEYHAPAAEESAAAKVAAKRPPIVNYPEEGFETMTKQEWKNKYDGYKSVKTHAAADGFGTYRMRWVMTAGCSMTPVYISDAKTIEIPR